MLLSTVFIIITILQQSSLVQFYVFNDTGESDPYIGYLTREILLVFATAQNVIFY